MELAWLPDGVAENSPPESEVSHYPRAIVLKLRIENAEKRNGIRVCVCVGNDLGIDVFGWTRKYFAPSRILAVVTRLV